jgi:hypothetical protein
MGLAVMMAFSAVNGILKIADFALADFFVALYMMYVSQHDSLSGGWYACGRPTWASHLRNAIHACCRSLGLIL